MNIIVVGCGRVGGRLAALLSEDGHNVSVVDRRVEAFKEVGRDFNGRTVKGVGFDEDVLREAGIEECDVVAAVTSNDNTNLMTAEVARRIFGVQHVIIRLYEARREKTYMQLGIDYACGTALVAEEIFAKIQAGHANHIDTFGGYEIIRFALNLDSDSPVQCIDLEQSYDARVVAVEHDDETVLATKSTVLHDGDIVLACVSRHDVNDFSRYMRS